ncbi:MAG: MFS transporter, partial [Actinomycetota bacterium]|nr:MFS transporter [Actinomycetota bacterium]
MTTGRSVDRAEAGPAHPGAASYVRLLRDPACVRPFAASLLARLPVSMVPIGALLLVSRTHGSYSAAGVTTGAFALGTSCGAPLWGRLMDRYGQRAVLVPATVTSAALLAGLAVAAVARLDVPVLVLLAALAGVSYPPFSAAMRSAWRVVVADETARRAGYALDAVAVETLFVLGPLLLSVLLVLTPPVAPLLITAALLAVGGVGYGLGTAAGRCRPDPRAAAGGCADASPPG